MIYYDLLVAHVWAESTSSHELRHWEEKGWRNCWRAVQTPSSTFGNQHVHWPSLSAFQRRKNGHLMWLWKRPSSNATNAFHGATTSTTPFAPVSTTTYAIPALWKPSSTNGNFFSWSVLFISPPNPHHWSNPYQWPPFSTATWELRRSPHGHCFIVSSSTHVNDPNPCISRREWNWGLESIYFLWTWRKLFVCFYSTSILDPESSGSSTTTATTRSSTYIRRVPRKGASTSHSYYA